SPPRKLCPADPAPRDDPIDPPPPPPGPGGGEARGRPPPQLRNPLRQPQSVSPSGDQKEPRVTDEIAQQDYPQAMSADEVAAIYEEALPLNAVARPDHMKHTRYQGNDLGVG